MSVPTTNLYNFITQVLENKFLIKYFYPWGEKAFQNIIDNWEDRRPNVDYKYLPVVLCHDQEPLDFDLYNDGQFEKQQPTLKHKRDLSRAVDQKYKDLNLRWADPLNESKYWILLHSELNSPQVIQYESTGLFKCVYWWSHAAIARDWYRFANYDQRLLESHSKVANWLVYARDTTGKREYRKHFLDLLKFVSSVQLGSIDNGVVTSNSSAEYDHNDYTKTNCSIVLETVFDNRIHLTEKTLRPIACGHPFMILSGPETLTYLRSYGFKTFHPFIDESYDLETDLDKRMIMVLSEMDRINKLPQEDQDHIWKACAVVARHNKELFFSDRFFNSITQELRNNVLSI